MQVYKLKEDFLFGDIGYMNYLLNYLLGFYSTSYMRLKINLLTVPEFYLPHTSIKKNGTIPFKGKKLSERFVMRSKHLVLNLI